MPKRKNPPAEPPTSNGNGPHAAAPAPLAERSPKKPRFAILKPQVRHISEQVIKKKWTTLPESVQSKVRQLFKAVEQPVIIRDRDEKKRMDAQTAMKAVVRNLGRRLPRMPFPPTTKETDFDYETILNENRALETQLATTINSIELLRAETRREEAGLARDTERLDRLKRNARTAQAERRKQAKKEHPMLQQLDAAEQSAEPDPTTVDIDLSGLEADVELETDSDPDLAAILRPFRGHLASMRANAAQVSGLRDAVTRARAALDTLPLDDEP